MALGVYYKIPIYPIFNLLKGDYMLKALGFRFLGLRADKLRLSGRACAESGKKTSLQSKFCSFFSFWFGKVRMCLDVCAATWSWNFIWGILCLA